MANCSPAFAQNKLLEFEQLSLREGLSQSHVYCIIQDSQGFIWFGTQDGLNRFDGYHFKVYKKELSNNQINCLALDKDKNLWIGTDNGLNKYDYRQNSFVSYLPNDSKLLDKKISALLVDNNNNLWIGTPKGLNKIALTNNKQDIKFETPAILKDQSINCIYEDLSGFVWVGTQEALFKSNKNASQFQQSSLDKTQGISIKSIFQPSKGRYWVGTSKGILKVNGTIVEKVKLGTTESSLVVNSIQSDSNGGLWLGTDKGLHVVDLNSKENTIQSFFRNSSIGGSLSSNQIFQVYKDNTGIMWLGTYIGGINKYDPRWRNFTHISQENSGLNSNNIKSFCEGNDNTLWIATYQGGLNRMDLTSRKFTIYNAPGHLKDNDVQVVFKDSNGTIWIGTKRNGLCKYNVASDSFEYYPLIQDVSVTDSSKALLSAYVRDIFEDSQNNLWIATWDGGLSKITFFNGDYSIKHYQHDPNNPQSIRSNSIYTVTQDEDGNIWIGTRGGGLNKFDPNQDDVFEYYQYDSTNVNSISSDRPICILESKSQKGKLWVGTYGAGFNLFDRESGKFTRFSEKDGLPNDVVYGILEGSDNYLWISTNKGLAKFDPNTKAFSNYDVFDGLQSNEFNAGAYYKTQNDSLLFFGGINGLTFFRPRDIQANTTKPPVIITDFQLLIDKGSEDEAIANMLEQHISETQAFTLRYYQNFFSLEFVALNYTHTEKNKYAYRLLGFEDEWNETYDQRLITYTNLDPGKYTFEIKATNNDGVWSDTKTLKIRIRPPFWQTWWFRILAAIIVVSSAYAIYRYRINRIQQRKEELEREVKAQTAQINLQKEEIMATLENLKNTQTQLLESDKMASLGQLTAGIAHEINNPINFVYAGTSSLKANLNDMIEVLEAYEEVNAENAEEKLKEIMELKEDMEFDEVLEEINDLTDSIRRGAERTAEIVKGLRTFSRLDEDDVKKADMHENLDATLSILRNQIKNRIEIVKEYSDIPQIDCYPGKLNQVFMNILSNASQAIEGKGTITIRTSKVDDNHILIGIKDSGAGMPEDVKKRIFEPFFTTKDVGKGTGLGLSITHSIMEKHQGKIDVESEIGVGTEFLLTLPIRLKKETKSQSNVSEQTA